MKITKIEGPYPITISPCMCGEIAYPFRTYNQFVHLIISCDYCGIIKHAKNKMSLTELIKDWNKRPTVEKLLKEIKFLKKQNKPLVLRLTSSNTGRSQVF